MIAFSFACMGGRVRAQPGEIEFANNTPLYRKRLDRSRAVTPLMHRLEDTARNSAGLLTVGRLVILHE